MHAVHSASDFLSACVFPFPPNRKIMPLFIMDKRARKHANLQLPAVLFLFITGAGFNAVILKREERGNHVKYRNILAEVFPHRNTAQLFGQ